MDIAQIENKLSIKSTYFINLHSIFYNPLEKSQTKIIKKIIELNHDIGIHFDSDFYEINSKNELINNLEIEKRIFADCFDYEVTSFSFHNPNSFLLSFDEFEYANLINCYSKKLKKNTIYFSDSNGYIKFSDFNQFLNLSKNKSLHILTHPGWWHSDNYEPYEKILKISFNRFQKQYFYQEKYKGKLSSKEYYGSADSISFIKEIDMENYFYFINLWYLKKFNIIFFEMLKVLRKELVNIIKSLLDNYIDCDTEKIEKKIEINQQLSKIIEIFLILLKEIDIVPYNSQIINSLIKIKNEELISIDTISEEKSIEFINQIVDLLKNLYYFFNIKKDDNNSNWSKNFGKKFTTNSIKTSQIHTKILSALND